MKGIIFNVVEDAVVAEHGEDTWDALLESAGVSGEYTSLGDYPDRELTALVSAGAHALASDPDDLTRHLGHQALLGLADRYPHYFAPHDDAFSFLLTLNDVIHPEVRKLHPGSTPPTFVFDASGEETLVIHYASPRRLCVLAEGMIAGAGAHFGQSLDVEQTACVKHGDARCTLRTTLARSHPDEDPPA